MTSLIDSMRRLFQRAQPIPAGTYHFQSPPETEMPYRMHLRIEPDGSGVLILNAATILHLNPTAAEFAYHLILGTTEEEAARSVASRYRVNKAQALMDYKSLVERIQALLKTPDLDPELYLDFERTTPYSQKLSAPYRLDCAITYQVPDGSPATAAPTDRVQRELNTREWTSIMDDAWSAGIPHIVFTGGEPTLREDLPDLIGYAEAKGQVSGLLSDGLRLADSAYLQRLLQTGLDHLMMVLQPENAQSWAALQNVLAADLFVCVHITLTSQQSDASNMLKRLAEMGVKAVSLSASDPSLKPQLQLARDQAASLGLSLVWDLPTPYSSLHPVALELAEHGEEKPPAGAGKAWLYVEPDGDVLPAQGVNRVLGNMLKDSWESIWQKAQAA